MRRIVRLYPQNKKAVLLWLLLLKNNTTITEFVLGCWAVGLNILYSWLLNPISEKANSSRNST